VERSYDEILPRAGLRASLRRSNFKADRRQILVADDGSGGWIGVAPAAAERGIAVAIAGGVAATWRQRAQDRRLVDGR